MSNVFKRAERKLAKLRLGISGPSGSGKTWSALTLATAMFQKVALLDTERRGHLYAEDFNFDILELDAPYLPERYIQCIKQAEQAGYEVLIIDSLSHCWNGEGGICSMVDSGGGWFSKAGRLASTQQNLLVDAIITSKLHIISTLRSKTAYAVEEKSPGRATPRKVGMEPIQKPGLEYEFTMLMEMNQDHYAHVSKDNTKLYDQQIIKPTKEMGEHILRWLSEGKAVEELHKEDLIKIESKLKIANDVTELNSSYLELVRQYPNLKDNIIPICTKIKESLLNKLSNEDIAI